MPPKQRPRKAPDAVIQRRKIIDAEVRVRLEAVKDQVKAEAGAKWAEDQFRKSNLKGITPEQRKMREDEIRMANKELVLVRRKKLTEQYENDLQQWSAELDKQGLAIMAE